MRNLKVALGAAAISVALVVPASAGAATIYGGLTEGNGQFAMDVEMKKGKPKRITGIRGARLPAQCEITGDEILRGTFPLDLKVDKKGRFSGSLTQPVYGNVSTLKGRFNKQLVKGSLLLNYHYLAQGDLPEEDCATPELGFVGAKGSPNLTIDPPAARR